MRLTHEDIRKALGNVDETVITEVVSTGATAQELAQAKAWVANDEALINAGTALPAGRLARLVGILEALEESDDQS
jgi:hypothetical protein